MDAIVPVAVLLPLWTLLASPFLLAFFLSVRRVRRRAGRVHRWQTVPLALVFALLAAPVPTPIITVFLPHALATWDGSYYDRILHGPAIFAGLWPWVAWSLALTFAVSLTWAWRYVRR